MDARAAPRLWPVIVMLFTFLPYMNHHIMKRGVCIHQQNTTLLLMMHRLDMHTVER